MEYHAPREVIIALSPSAYECLKLRVNGPILKTYIEPVQNIRIRGLRPSVFYVSYSVLRHNRLEQFYETSAEEKEASRIVELRDRIWKFSHEEASRRATEESAWVAWENQFAEFKPDMIPKTEYRDVQGNTYLHMVAYSCNSRRICTLNEFYSKFRESRFETNELMQATNHHGQTPCQILMEKHEHGDLVESLLLQMPASKRLACLQLQHWSSNWGSLNRDMIENHIELFIHETRMTENVLPIFIQLTYRNNEALDRLFSSRYIIRPHHVKTQMSKTDLFFLGVAVLKYPNWHNITLLISIVQAQPWATYTDIVELIQTRANLMKDELLAIALNPDRIASYYAQGLELGKLDTVI